MNCINIRALLYLYMSKKKTKDSFLDLLYRDRAPLISNCRFLRHGRSVTLGKRGKKPFQYSLISHYQLCYVKNQTNKEKPAIGIEPMTIALQMRCSNL